ncbi:hypothetical protein Golob_024611, partial [Gossypium lobatum]|nr:hypothetical protein [Gossypium lobatum]
QEKGDSLAERYVSELWDFTSISVTQNSLQELKEIWDQWNEEVRQLFYSNYRDLPYLLDIKCEKIQVDRVYSRAVNPPTFLKRLMNITGMNAKKRVDVFALSIYGLVIFPKALGHVDEAVTDLFDQLDKGITPVPAILAETFRSLNACQRAGEAIPMRDNISVEKWMAILQNLQEEDIEWRVPWLLPDEILYRYGDFDWGLAECEFSYGGDGYKKKIREISNSWNQTRRMKRLAVRPMITPEYNKWW